MSNSQQSDVEKQLAKLQQTFKSDLDNKIVDIERLWEIACKETSDIAPIEELFRLAHSLTGAAGTFGAMAVSAAARKIEHGINALLNNIKNETSTEFQNSESLQEIKEQLEDLKDKANAWQPSEIPYIKKSKEKEKRKGNLVYLVDDDELLAKDIKTKLEDLEFYVKNFSNVRDFENECDKELPSAIIMDMVFSEGDIAGAEVINKLKNKFESCPPVVFISVRADIDSRLAATRAGASRYLCKPVDTRKLGKTLDGLIERTEIKPYRVVIVDDDESLLQYYATILRDAAFDVAAISNPLECLDTLEMFKPDVLVSDVYMPDCSGLELAQVVRQDDAWALMPIMFLSTETDIDNQLMAMNLGGNDFLVKSGEPHHFISAVLARAKRARWVNRLNNDLSDSLRENHFQITAMNQHDIMSEADISGRITKVNEKFCDISGYTRKELIGQNHRILKSDQHSDELYKELWGTISKGDVWRGIICNRRKDGHLYWVNSTIVPFLDEDGNPYKYVSMRTDITNLKISEDRLDRSQNIANIGTWDWKIKEDLVYWSSMAKQLYGLISDLDEVSSESYFEIVHPEDREQVGNAVKACLEHGEKYEVVHRVIWPSGEIHWVQESGDAIRNAQGEPTHMLGVVQDVTEKVESEIKQQGSNKILEQIAIGTERNEVLKTIITHAENVTHGAMASVLLLNSSGDKLEKGVAPKLPGFYNDAIDDLDIGMGVGSCGEAAFSGERVIVSDVMQHPNWNAFRELAKKAGLGACWAEPFYSSSGSVLGTFAIYFKQPAVPKNSDLEFMTELAQFAAIVVERDKAQQALLVAKEDAENANQSKSQFLSSMSHELRTPMNAIMGFGQLLTMETDHDLSESQQENVNEIVKAGSHLLELINEVLDLAKVESGHIDLSIETVAIDEVILESLQLITPLAGKRGIEISLRFNGAAISLEDFADKGVAVRADRTRLRQILLNLLSNAVKYNNENGKIIIACKYKEGTPVRIEVSDTGSGITQEDQEQLFKAFTRLGTESDEVEGTGIGLVITKNIVELMNGNIGVESKVGIGSKFWFELPFDTLSSSDNGSGIDEILPNSEAELSQERKYTVLYIEDNPANLRLVSQLLARIDNVHMWSAHEPLLGLELATENKPDLILLDINLPGMDGFGVLEQLRQRDETRNTPVIAISANAMPKDIEKGMNAGFDDYITKPIDVKELLNVVSNVLNKISTEY